MAESKLASAADIFAKVAIPLIIGGLGILVSTQQMQIESDRAKQIREIEDIKTVTELMTDDNERKRQMGEALARHLILSDRLPAPVIQSIYQYQKLKAHEEQAKAVQPITQTAPDRSTELLTQQIETIGQQDALIQKTIDQVNDTLPARVYFHIPDEQWRQTAKEVAELLTAFTTDAPPEIGLPEIQVPGVELISASPNNSELRCFRKGECESAYLQEIHNLLKQPFADLEIIDLSERYKGSTRIRPKHFELWVGKNTPVPEQQ